VRRVALIAVVAAGVIGVLWVAGELHVRNCQQAGKINCTVLPWSGDKAGSPRVDWSGAGEYRDGGVGDYGDGGSGLSGLPAGDGFPDDNNGGFGN